MEVLSELVGYVGVRGGRQRRRHLINYSKLLGENIDSDSEGERERERRKGGKEGGVFLRSRERRTAAAAAPQASTEIWTEEVREGEELGNKFWRRSLAGRAARDD